MKKLHFNINYIMIAIYSLAIGNTKETTAMVKVAF